MPLTESQKSAAEHILQEYCAGRTAPELRDKLEIVYRFEGNCAFIAERRPDWRNPKVSRDEDVAKFRFMVKSQRWVLYWCDSNLRWHVFPETRPAKQLFSLLPVVDREPIFYG